jgi:hypothetical protein
MTERLTIVQLDPDTLTPMADDDPRRVALPTQVELPTTIWWCGDGYYEFPDGIYGKRGRKL